MISNEHGVVFLNVPFSGFEFLKEVLLKSNPETSFEDEIIDDCIEYEYVALVKNPYYRAAAIYKNGCKLRKELKLKSQNFSEYFENTLNRWDFVESDVFETQTSYFPEKDLTMFAYEKLLDSWSDFNQFISSAGLNTIQYYTDPDPIKNWETHYEDKIAVELVNYIFEDDFENLGYTKL
tara:strand:+ start:1173 stop:1709 length:537 start_codon:yes stop_codon:yes gene_type:complete